MQSSERPPIPIRAVIIFLAAALLVATITAIYYYSVASQCRAQARADLLNEERR